MSTLQPFSTALIEAFRQLMAITGCRIQWKDIDEVMRQRMPRDIVQHLHPRCMAFKQRDLPTKKRCQHHCGFQTYDAQRDGTGMQMRTCHAGCVTWRFPVFHRGDFLGLVSIGPLRRGQVPADLPAIPPAIDDICALIYRLITLLADDRARERLDHRYIGRVHPALEGLLDLLRQDARHDLDAAGLARRCHLSVSRLQHLCRDQLGDSLGHLRDRALLQRAQEALRHTGPAIASIAYDLGFPDQRYFSTWFRRLTGSSPSAWRTEHRAQEDS